MKAREIRNLTIEEVEFKKQEVEKELFNLKIRQATRQIDNPLKVRVLRTWRG
jgi:large subunit ribosomal protein L29